MDRVLTVAFSLTPRHSQANRFTPYLLHPWACCPQNLTVSVFIDCNGYILIFAAPVPFQINATHIHIGILSTLKQSVSPLFDVFVCLLVQFADR